MIPSAIPKSSLGAVLVLGMLGCAGKHLAPSRLPPVPELVPGYSALCAARWQSRDKTWRARVAVAFLPPERIRLEVLDPAGNSRSVLIATDQGALLLDPPRRAYRSYPSATQATRDLVGIAARPQSLAHLLLGPAVLRSEAACGGDATSGAESKHRCLVPGGGELLFAAGVGDRATLSLPGEAALELAWGKASQGGRSLPGWVELRQITPAVTLHLETKELRFSAPDVELFSLSAPAGFSPARDGEIP